MEGHEEEKHGVVTEHEGIPRHDGMETRKEDHSGEMEHREAVDPMAAMKREDGKTRSWYPETYNAYEPIYDTFVINGRSFPYTEPIEVKEGEKVRLRIINVGYEPHFVHTHSHKFLIVAMDGSPAADPQERDTVQVGPGQRIDILLTADNPGLWPLHCHRLPHVANDHIYPGGMLAIIRYME